MYYFSNVLTKIFVKYNIYRAPASETKHPRFPTVSSVTANTSRRIVREQWLVSRHKLFTSAQNLLSQLDTDNNNSTARESIGTAKVLKL